MKALRPPLQLLLLLAAASAPRPAWSAPAANRTITQVVKLLQGLVAKSHADGERERELYAKHKCYCDTNEASKKAEVGELADAIELLDSKIAELKASTGKLSQQVGQLAKSMEEKKAARQEALVLRGAEFTAFSAKEADLGQAIGQMDAAIDTLAEIGADQTIRTGADHEQYMAGRGASFAKLKTSTKQALLAACAFLDKKQVASVGAFLQAPFTGTYTAQSGEVVGILKDMRDTFKANLATAQADEARASEAYGKFMGDMQVAFADMDKSFNSKQATLSGNDGDLSSKKTQLQGARTQKQEAEDFLAKLLTLCAAKKAQHDKRVELRGNEDLALSEAISILNSDAAFATFGAVDATATGATGFLQRSAIRRHRRVAPLGRTAASPRQQAEAFLQSVAGSKGSPLLSRIMALLQANNPFTVVLGEIDKMIDLVKAEEKADDEQKAWCGTERTTSDASIAAKASQITTLKAEIDELTTAIENPSTGLKASIALTEAALRANYEDQVTETKDRKEEELDYQKNVANLVEAEALLERAIVVLKKYYSKISATIKGGFLQVRREEPAPPGTWDDAYKGQSEAGGTDAISMLEFIRKNAGSEEATAHMDEKTAQHLYEDSMQDLKAEEKDLHGTLAASRRELARKEEARTQKQKDLAATEREREALEEYLVELKPGCDFITSNIEVRRSNRATETAALRKAAELLRAAPAYQEAVALAHSEGLGECREICARSEAHADCQACLAETSVPGYCAGHPAAEGC